MRKILLFVLLSLLCFSCSREQEDVINSESNGQLVKEINYFVFFPSYMSLNETDVNFSFQYNSKNQLVKKVGGFISSSSAVGVDFFSTDLYTSLVYENNKVTVENFSSISDVRVPKQTTYYTIEGNKILVREIPRIFTTYSFSERETFKYDNNRIVEIKKDYPGYPYLVSEPVVNYLEKFSYDSTGNLVKTEAFELVNGVETGKKTVKTFEDYDKSTNPWKRMNLLSDVFYRSISQNNYRKSTEAEYNRNGEKVSYVVKTWGFSYDAQGNIILVFNK